MRKYWAIFKANWQASVEYRSEFIAHIIRGLITFVVLFFIFKAVFLQTNNFAGYTFSSIFTYLVMVRVLHFSTRGNTARLIADEIRQGIISFSFLKPINYFKYQFSLFLADRLFEIFLRIFLILLFLFLFPSYFSFPSLPVLLLFFLFLLGALVFNFLFNLLLAGSAFWVTDIRLFSTFVGLTTGFFAGELIPLDTLPPILKKIGFFLPFQYTLFFPIKIYQESLGYKEILRGILVFLLWLGLIIWLVRFLWQKGVKRYEAVGQ